LTAAARGPTLTSTPMRLLIIRHAIADDHHWRIGFDE